MATRILDRERGLKTGIVGRDDGIEENELFGAAGAAAPMVVSGPNWPNARALVKLAASIGGYIGGYLLDLNDRLSGPPLTQRERDRFAIGPWETYSRYRIDK
jgi:hypothetical protein